MADRRSAKSYKKKDSEDEYDDEDLADLPEMERERKIMERFEKRQKEKRRQEVLERDAKGSMNKSGASQKNDVWSHMQSKRQSAKDRKERIAAENRDESEEEDEASSSESDGEISNKRRRKKDDDDDFAVDEEDRKRIGMKPEKKRRTSQERRSPEKPEMITADDLEKIRLSRKQLAQLVSHTIFEKTVIGTFVRVNVSSGMRTNSQATAHDYAIAQVIGVQTYKKFYPLDEKETNQILLLKHGTKENPMKMCFISNGEFTGAEFTKWINRMQRENLKVPTRAEIKEKAEQIERGLKYRYTNEEIRKNIDQRVQEKIQKGHILTTHEIELLENKKFQKEKEYWSAGSKDEHLKKEIDHLSEDIKKAREAAKKPPAGKQPGKKVDEKKVAMEMDEMFGDEEEEEEQKPKEKPGSKKTIQEEQKIEVEEEDEEEKLSREKMLEEMKRKGLTMIDMYNQMKRDFVKNHKVDLSIDKIIEEWNPETEVL